MTRPRLSLHRPAFSYLEAHCQRAGADLFSACAALIDRTCNAVALILKTAAEP